MDPQVFDALVAPENHHSPGLDLLHDPLIVLAQYRAGPRDRVR
jgi:hypothetical protein